MPKAFAALIKVAFRGRLAASIYAYPAWVIPLTPALHHPQIFRNMH